MRALMGKYRLFATYGVLTRIYIKVYSKYPAGLFLKLVYLPVQMLMYVFLWFTMSGAYDVDMKYVVTYYLLTNLLVYAYPYVHIANDIEYDVMEGGISNYLVRPIHYSNPILCKYVAWMCLYSIIFVPAILFVYFYKGFTLVQIGLFLLSAVIGMGVEFMFWYNVGLISFRMESIRGVITAMIALRMFVSGSMIPLSFFPKVVREMTYFFPFRFYVYVPVNSLLGEMGRREIVINLIAGGAWLVGLILLSKVLWNQGVRRVEGNIS